MKDLISDLNIIKAKKNKADITVKEYIEKSQYNPPLPLIIIIIIVPYPWSLLKSLSLGLYQITRHITIQIVL